MLVICESQKPRCSLAGGFADLYYIPSIQAMKLQFLNASLLSIPLTCRIPFTLILNYNCSLLLYM